MTDKLVLGRTPAGLELRLVKGDPWSAALTLKDKSTGNNEPWPSPPVLEFDRADVQWTATLSNGDATATWNQTEADVTAVTARTDRVSLSVDGLTWWRGSVSAS